MMLLCTGGSEKAMNRTVNVRRHQPESVQATKVSLIDSSGGRAIPNG